VNMLRVWPIVCEFGVGLVLCVVGLWAGLLRDPVVGMEYLWRSLVDYFSCDAPSGWLLFSCFRCRSISGSGRTSDTTGCVISR